MILLFDIQGFSLQEGASFFQKIISMKRMFCFSGEYALLPGWFGRKPLYRFFRRFQSGFAHFPNGGFLFVRVYVQSFPGHVR